MRNDIGVEIDVDFGRAQHTGIDHRGEVALAVKVVRGERTGRYVARITRDGAHAVEVECLAVEDVADETFFQQIDEILGRAAAHEAGFHVGLLHHCVRDSRQRPARFRPPRLKGEAVAHDARVAQKSRDEFGDAQAVGGARDLRRAADDLCRIADGVDLDDIVDIVALDLPGTQGKGTRLSVTTMTRSA